MRQVLLTAATACDCQILSGEGVATGVALLLTGSDMESGEPIEFEYVTTCESAVSLAEALTGAASSE